MTLDDIKSAVANMPEQQQSQLAAYLVHLRHERDPQLREEIARRIDDKTAEQWVSLEQLRQQWKE